MKKNNMENLSEKMIISRNNKRHKVIKLPKSLNSFLQTQTITNWQGRIIYSILNLIKDYQLSDDKNIENQQQLELFRLYWSDDNSTVTFNFHFSDFVPKGVSYKRGQIEQALKDLVTIGLSEQEEIIEGKQKKRFTGIIFNPIWEPKNHTCSFQMTSSWFKLFMIAIPYESWLFEETLLLSARARKFLLLLFEYEFMAGFFKYRKDLCAFLGIELQRLSNIEKDFLFPIRDELDNKGELSFNWSYSKDLDRFDFKIYRLKNADAEKTIPKSVHLVKSQLKLQEPKNRDIIKERKISINAALKYTIKARKLNEEEKQILFNICMKYGYDEIKSIIKNTTKNNVENSFKSLEGMDFINKILYKYPL